MKQIARTRPILVAGLVLFVGLAASMAFAAGDVEKGRAIFTGTGEELEYPSCAQCHATVSAETELKQTKQLRPAYPVFNTSHRGAWKNKKHREQWINTLTEYAFPVIGKQRVDHVDTPDILRLLSPIWLTKP